MIVKRWNRLQKLLFFLARHTVKRYDPFIIGVTGAVGKTSAKNAIFQILDGRFSVRKNYASFNNEFGLPITILSDLKEKDLKIISRYNDKNGAAFKKVFLIFRIVTGAFFKLIFKSKKYPKFLVLEYGAQGPGDMKTLTDIAKPSLGIITAIGEIPAHIENYPDVDSLIREKTRLIENLFVSQYAILNNDDFYIEELKERTRGKIITFGFKDDSDLKIVSYDFKISHNLEVNTIFKIQYNGNFLPVRLNGFFGLGGVYSASVALVVASIFKINLVEASGALEKLVPESQRMNIIRGWRNSIIIDDSYNASLASSEFAIRGVGGVSAKRKVLFFGDMLELGKLSETAHRKVGKLAAKNFDVLCLVGKDVKFIKEEALALNFSEDSIKIFPNSELALKGAQDLIKDNDLVLIKGSRGMKMEKIVQTLKSKDI